MEKGIELNTDPYLYIAEVTGILRSNHTTSMSPDEIGLVRKLWEPVKCSFENSLLGSSLEVDHGLSTNPDPLHRIGGGGWVALLSRFRHRPAGRALRLPG